MIFNLKCLSGHSRSLHPYCTDKKRPNNKSQSEQSITGFKKNHNEKTKVNKNDQLNKMGFDLKTRKVHDP